MSRFKKGDIVYMGRGEHLQELIVDKVIDNPLLPIYQYTFKGKKFASGEQSIRATADGPDLKINQCFKKTHSEEAIATKLNSIFQGARKSVDMEDYGVGKLFSSSSLFFKPELDFCEWLKEYAGDRMIIDVGAGQGHLVRMLKMTGAKAMGLEPNYDPMLAREWRIGRGDDFDINEILPWTVEKAKGLIEKMGAEKAMLVFARPCHSDFVYNGIYNMPKGMEALYITKPENLIEYDDLGRFKKEAVLLNHKGRSEDNEVIYSIVR